MAVTNLESAHATTPQATCGRIADVPEPAITFPSPRPVRLKLAHDLMASFSRGEGDFVRTPRSLPLKLAERLQLEPLPWELAEGRRDNARLAVWQDKTGNNDDNMRAMVLDAGESWCSPEYDLQPGSRLRFEGLSIDRDAPSVLSVTLRRRDGVTDRAGATLPFPGRFTAKAQTDLGLEAKPSRICLRATGGAAAIGEARLLAPEPAGSDHRPQWIVLTIEDDLRGDVLRGGLEERSFLVPTLSALAQGGHVFEKAISPGCHTNAAVWPILMGRDLMRIDPLKRRQSMPNQAPLEDLYSRANLFVTHIAEAAGYHSAFLGNNAYFRRIPAFSRLSSWGTTDNGTLDTIRALPDLFERYGDERLLLVYYVTAPHGNAQTPRRLFDAFGCAKLTGSDQCSCNYRARVRHGDEALEQLQKGLKATGLDRDTFQVITADHGELFDEGMKLEGEIRTGHEVGLNSAYVERFDQSHGRGCFSRESDVPLVVNGPGVAPAVSADPVSGLDIFPTLLGVLKMPALSRLDGIRLPISGGRSPANRRFVSYGFCSDSVITGNEQLIWWLQGCQVREQGSETPIDYRSELWSVSGQRLVATEKTEPSRLHRAMSEHEAWLRDRLPTEALVFGLDHAGKNATITLQVEGGIITDFGPAGTVDGLDRIAGVAADSSRLTVRFEGYEGLYYVSTLPPRAPVRIDLELDGKPARPLTFVGPLQIPLDTAGRWIAPGTLPNFFVSHQTPDRRRTDRLALRLWWRPHGVPSSGDSAPALSEFDRVLREWGYIR